MKTNRPNKIAGYAELFVKLHVLTEEQKKDIIKFVFTYSSSFFTKTNIFNLIKLYVADEKKKRRARILFSLIRNIFDVEQHRFFIRFISGVPR